MDVDTSEDFRCRSEQTQPGQRGTRCGRSLLCSSHTRTSIYKAGYNHSKAAAPSHIRDQPVRHETTGMASVRGRVGGKEAAWFKRSNDPVLQYVVTRLDPCERVRLLAPPVRGLQGGVAACLRHRRRISCFEGESLIQGGAFTVCIYPGISTDRRDSATRSYSKGGEILAS